jgi:tRNA 5-methylaminomethyl-2-thiouridine biosynthesis bifunctional protein
MSDAVPILPARLEWRGAVPVSTEYGDVYFSQEGGLEETRYVFLEGNRLIPRFTQAVQFVIAELGFGTGLNVMAAWQAWDAHASPEARLHIFSIEKHPLTKHDLIQAHAAWPILAPQAERLQALYPPPIPGFHTLALDSRVTLTLCFGEASAMLAQMHCRVDAWFLDGFSPARNEGMWQRTLLHQIASKTAPNGTLATFTAASAVRDGLAEAGFNVERRSGFGRKRHMTCAVMPGDGQKKPRRPEQVVIIGAGIAGLATAHALAEQGIQVTVLEQKAGAAQGASAVPSAMLFPRLAKTWSPATRFDWAALYDLHRQSLVQESASGLLQLPKKQRGGRNEEEWLSLPERLGLSPEVLAALSAVSASDKAGISLSLGGLFLPKSGIISLQALALKYAEHPFIKIIPNCVVRHIVPDAGGWRLESDDGRVWDASSVVIANAWQAASLFPALTLPMIPVRGQMTRLPAHPLTSSLRCALGYGGYIAPLDAEGGQWVGATFERGETDAVVHSNAHQANLAKLAEIMPQAAEAFSHAVENLSGWAGIRATTPDRLPIIGQAVDAHGEPASGLYVTLAHGARGALSGPLGGRFLAARILDLPVPVEADAMAAFDPARFIRRSR